MALKGYGIAELFATAVAAVREAAHPLPQPASQHIRDSLQHLSHALNRPEINAAFHVPHPLLKTIGRREAWYSVALSVSMALAVSGAVRLLLEGARLIAA